jgi:hypothetical protein
MVLHRYCPSDAVAPTPPAVTDACGRAITPTVTTPSPVTCNGTMVYTFTYADCAGHTHDWTYTYTLLLLILPFQLMVLQR